MGFPAGRELWRQHLDGHAAMQHGVKRVEHDAHAAAAEHAQDFIVGDLADGLRIQRREQKRQLSHILFVFRLVLGQGGGCAGSRTPRRVAGSRRTRQRGTSPKFSYHVTAVAALAKVGAHALRSLRLERSRHILLQDAQVGTSRLAAHRIRLHLRTGFKKIMFWRWDDCNKRVRSQPLRKVIADRHCGSAFCFPGLSVRGRDHITLEVQQRFPNGSLDRLAIPDGSTRRFPSLR